MLRFYYYFQWVGLFLVPALTIYCVSIMGGRYEANLASYITSGFATLFLVGVAFFTTRTNETNPKKSLSKRVAGLLEPVYLVSIALLLTGGSTSGDDELFMPPIVAVLTSRGMGMSSAVTINSTVQASLYVALFLFALTACIVALRDYLQNNSRHYSAERYEILYDNPEAFEAAGQQEQGNTSDADDNNLPEDDVKDKNPEMD